MSNKLTLEAIAELDDTTKNIMIAKSLGWHVSSRINTAGDHEYTLYDADGRKRASSSAICLSEAAAWDEAIFAPWLTDTDTALELFKKMQSEASQDAHYYLMYDALDWWSSIHATVYSPPAIMFGGETLAEVVCNCWLLNYGGE